MMRKVATIFVAMVLAFGIVACASYYQVKDPTGGSIYYTQKLKQKRGSITFQDAKTGSTVTLQNSEIKEISKEAFNEEVPGSK